MRVRQSYSVFSSKSGRQSAVAGPARVRSLHSWSMANATKIYNKSGFLSIRSSSKTREPTLRQASQINDRLSLFPTETVSKLVECMAQVPIMRESGRKRNMSLVCLDISQIHLLSKEGVQNKERFSNFLKMWKDNRCVLALSRIHLFEICRYVPLPCVITVQELHELTKLVADLRLKPPFAGWDYSVTNTSCGIIIETPAGQAALRNSIQRCLEGSESF